MPIFDMIAFDADDTLWHYEKLYVETQKKIAKLLTSYGNAEEIDAHLSRIELGNVPLYRYGMKGFALSMIEAAIKIGDNIVLDWDNTPAPQEKLVQIANEIRNGL